MQLDDNRWMNVSAHCSALPDCTLDLHNRAGDIVKGQYKDNSVLKKDAKIGLETHNTNTTDPSQRRHHQSQRNKYPLRCIMTH